MTFTQAQVDDLPPLRYQALENADDIRLLCLHPGSHEELIECSLYSTSREFDEYRYCALSYAWGDTQLPHAISCNGQRANITSNLFSALKRLRKESEEMMLWIDALCINQSTEPQALRERARQVEMMHIIFGSAESVIVDLGEVDEDTPLLLSNLALFDQQPLEFWSKPLKDLPDELMARMRVPSLKGSFFLVLAQFLQRPWFRRVWMFQEYVLAKELRFLLGADFQPEAFMSHYIGAACEWFLQVLNRGRTFYHGNVSMTEVVTQIIEGYLATTSRVRVRDHHHSSPTAGLQLANLMHVTQWLQATNPQDRVYSLLSLAKLEAPTRFSVIYTETPDETALRLSLFLLRHCPLYILYRCVGVEALTPSWLLTLAHRRIDALQTTWEPAGLNPWFHAGGSSPLAITLNHPLLSFTVRGVTVGRIASMARPWEVPDTAAASASAWCQTEFSTPMREISVWIDNERSRSSSPAPIPREIFWRTFIADMLNINMRAYRTRDFPDFLDSLNAFTRFIFDYTPGNEDPEQLAASNKLADLARLYTNGLPFSIGRRLSVLECGRPCLVPGNSCIGDVLCIVPGAPLPLVLRPQENDGNSSSDNFRIVGCCYIHDMMDGQVFENENQPPALTEIVIR